MFAYFKSCSWLLRLLWLSLLIMMFFSIINSFWYFKDGNAWLSLVGFYSIHQGTVSILFVYVVLAGFTFVIDIVRLIVLNAGDRAYGAVPYFTAMTIIGMVFKLVSAVFAVLARNDVDNMPSSSSGYSQSGYTSDTYATSSNKYEAGVGSSNP